ncbi:MAG: hypothetical protein LBF17_05670 [Mediterranea sp.]|jgi:hypothetical protein|nr:hypothetical protein [Mediterranea sp.]
MQTGQKNAAQTARGKLRARQSLRDAKGRFVKESRSGRILSSRKPSPESSLIITTTNNNQNQEKEKTVVAAEKEKKEKEEKRRPFGWPVNHRLHDYTDFYYLKRRFTQIYADYSSPCLINNLRKSALIRVSNR